MYKRNHWTEKAETWHVNNLKHGVLESVEKLKKNRK
jgi:hypothetical protein